MPCWCFNWVRPVNEPARELAGRRRRLVATLVDAVLVPALTLLLVMLTDVVEDAEDFADTAWVAHVFALAVLSYLLLNGFGLWRRGQTLGKQLMGIMVAPAASGSADAPASFWKLILIRAWFFPLMYLIVVPWLALIPLLDNVLILRSDRRCLHDLLAGTIVVRWPPRQNHSKGAVS